MFEKVFNFYKYKNEEYMQRYHQRSNVESVFSMMKAKFGGYVRSRSQVAMKNEAYGKIVCHNLCCLLMSQIELGIEPEFWAQKSLPKPKWRPVGSSVA